MAVVVVVVVVLVVVVVVVLSAKAVSFWPPIVRVSVVVRLHVGCARVSLGVVVCVPGSVLLWDGRVAWETRLVFVPVLEQSGSVVVPPALPLKERVTSPVCVFVVLSVLPVL